jgi:hypothetical protein
VRHTQHFLGVYPARPVIAPVIENIFHPAVEWDLLGVIRVHDFPRTAEHPPPVRMLHLMAFDKFLLKQTEFVIDAVTQRRVIQGG